MIAEMRTYTVNRGMMNSYLELFNKQIVPNHAKYGIHIIGAWVDRRQNEITWIRTFSSREDRKARLDAYEAGPERTAVFPITAYHMAKAEVRILEDAFTPAAEAVQAVLESPLADAARAAMAALPAAEAAAEKAAAIAPR